MYSLHKFQLHVAQFLSIPNFPTYFVLRHQEVYLYMEPGKKSREVYSYKCLYFKEKDRPEINNLNLHLNKLESEEQVKSKASRIIKTGVEIN